MSLEMKITHHTIALIGATLFSVVSANALPILTLTERNDKNLDWSWSDGTGSGTFTTAIADTWHGFTIPLPSGVTDSFYGRWEEDFPGHRNDVYLPFSGTAGFGTLYVTSDLVDLSPSLAALGSALDSYKSVYQIIFKDLGDHIVSTPDAGSAQLLLASSLGALAFLRRSIKAPRS